MQELRANTAVDVLIGPFVDSTDGDSEETALTISQADVRLSKNGQTAAQKNDTTACAHDADGMYNCELDATDTNTLGQLVLYVHETGALFVRHEYMVLTEAAWDAKYADGGAAVDTGTAAGAAAGTITLATSASATADIYNGMTVYILSGTGAGQSRVIHDYTTGRLASISPNWVTIPTGAVYQLIPTAPANQSEPIEVNATQVGGTAQTAGDLAALITTIDGLVDAIKAKTDDLTFTKANELDTNPQSINGAGLTGDGTSGTEWGPA